MHRVLILTFVAMLGGCARMSSLLSFEDKPDSPPAAAEAAAPIAVPPPDDSFCRNVAAQDASASGFDEATQKRIAQQSYAQCHAIYGNTTSR